MLTFTYKVADLISNAQTMSMYRARLGYKQPDEGLSSDSPLTLEDENIILRYLKLAANEVANAMAGYTTDLLDDDGVTELEPFEFTESTPVAPAVAEDILIFRVNMPTREVTTYTDGVPSTATVTTFNTAYTNQILNAIPDAIENYILSRICKNQGLEFQSYKEDFENAISKIKEYLTKRNVVVKRSMNMY